jgi:hypothetical protein
MSLDAATEEDASVIEDASIAEDDANVTLRADAASPHSDASAAGGGEHRGCAIGASSSRRCNRTEVLLALLAVFALRRLRRRRHTPVARRAPDAT